MYRGFIFRAGLFPHLPLSPVARCVQRSSDELLAPLDVAGRPGVARVGHDVPCEVGNVDGRDDTRDGNLGAERTTRIFELMAENGGRTDLHGFEFFRWSLYEGE